MPIDKDIKTRIAGAFRNIPEDDSFIDFVANVGAAAFNTEVRKKYTSHYVELDMSPSYLSSAGWSKLEVEFLHKAFKQLASKFAAHDNINYDGNNKLYFKGAAFGAKSVFQTHQPIFKDIAAKASDLLKADYPRARSLNHKELSDAIADLKAQRITQDSTKVRSLAYSRLFGIATEAGTRVDEGVKLTKKQIELLYEVHGGHLEGHENYRLAAATRFALGIERAGAEFIPDSVLERVIVLLKMDKETFTSIKNYVSGKVHANEYANTKIVQKTTMEVGTHNISKREEQLLAEALGTELGNLFEQWTKLRSTTEEVFGAGQSPSIIQRVQDFLTTILTDGKGKNKRADLFSLRGKKKYKPLKYELKNNPKLSRVKTKSKKTNLKSEIENVEETLLKGDIDPFRLKNLINEILALEVEKRMGDATDPAVKLRYQTGRFADSAKLLTLTKAQAGTLAGTYTYQRSPYDVFLPGHRLGNATRDPKIYVEGAIREAAMSILKRRFPGIVLELK